MPGQGIAGFFDAAPADPPRGDPFAEGSDVTPYEAYGFAGLRWHTYDLGCGPNAARNPDAVIGTSVANWLMSLPVAFASLTASLTEVAFEPTFLDTFDPLLVRISAALHDSLFTPWMPVVLGALGLLLLVKARGMALATATAAVAWAIFVLIVTAALFRWPVQAGHVADDTVTTSLGSVVDGLNGGERSSDPASAVASHVQASILYNAWLAGQLGSSDSATAQRFGGELFAAQTLTWREAELVHSDPDAGARLIEAKQQQYAAVAEQIKQEDPSAYQFLTGQRSETRVAYAFLATFATLLALPFLLVSALLLLGSFFVVRLAVMLFPAFATLGLFPAARGIVVGVGRTVGAAVINAVIFGVGAAVTIAVLGVILDPSTQLPTWLRLVLLPLFGLIMWVALKPFRRLTSMASMSSNPFGEAASMGDSAAKSKRLARKLVVGAASAYTGGAAAGVAAAKTMQDGQEEEPPERAEARPDPAPPPSMPTRPALEAAPAPATPQSPSPGPSPPRGPQPGGRPMRSPASTTAERGSDDRGHPRPDLGERAAAAHRAGMGRRGRGVPDLPARRRRSPRRRLTAHRESMRRVATRLDHRRRSAGAAARRVRDAGAHVHGRADGQHPGQRGVCSQRR